MTKSEKSDNISEEEQIKLLEESKINIKTQAFQMKRCLDTQNLMDALKHASNMISEMRTSLLSPRNYYSLYMEVFDHLRHLESYLLEEKHGKRMAELYELVQYAGNILPRLYLLVTVGSAYIKLKEAPAKDVLRDLVEMCRGVQHPTRGLFLRTYLSEVTKDKLPDTGSEYEGRGGTVKDSIDFILVNFTEMNKLWVRMQYQGPSREKEKRETERSELRLLVGKNIARLSQLEGVDANMYTTSVLPKLLDQIINCKDTIAQQYLIECIIQAFPDEFHLKTLEILLSTCKQVQSGVNIKAILVSLIDRLANFATRGENIPNDINVFHIISNQISQIVESQKTIPIEDILAIEASLLNLTIIYYPDQLINVDEIFKFCFNTLSIAKENIPEFNTNTTKQITKLLSIPLESYKNILTVLKLENYPKLMTFLTFVHKRKVAIDITKTSLESPSIPKSELVNKLLELIQPIVIKEENEKTEEIDEEDFEEEQTLVASLVHQFESEDLEELFAMYLIARKHFGQGGPKRIKYTLAPLVFGVLKLALRLKDHQNEDSDWAGKIKKVFKFAHETVMALSKTNLPDLSLRLFLQCAQASDKCGNEFETIAYEFITQAFVIYEEQIADSQAQFNAITLIIGTLKIMKIFGEENYDTLITKTALYSSKLLKKGDQCHAIIMSSHLFWCPEKQYLNSKRVLECLQKSIKIADTCVDSLMSVELLVEILNECLYYVENNCETVTSQYLTGLIEYINTKASGITETDASKMTTYYQNTLSFIKEKMENNPKFKDIKL